MSIKSIGASWDKAKSNYCKFYETIDKRNIYKETFIGNNNSQRGNKLGKQAGTELCQAQLKLASSVFCFRSKDNSGS